MRQVYALLGLVKKWGPERVEAAWVTRVELCPRSRETSSRRKPGWLSAQVAKMALERRVADGDLDPESLACCTGEEMAHLTVAMVETLVETGGLDDLAWMASPPTWRAEDDDAEWARSVLFRDHDVLWLFEESLDGAEAPDSEESAYHGLAISTLGTGSIQSVRRLPAATRPGRASTLA